MERAYAAWRAFQDRFLTHAAALLLIGCTLLALLEVVRRYVFGFSYEWQQDAVTFFILCGVFLFFGISQRHNEHLSVVVLLEVLQAGEHPGRKRLAEAIKLLALVISLFFMVAVLWWGLPEVRDAIEFESRTESLAFPMWPFLATLWAGFAFMAITLVFQVYFEVQRLRGRSVPEEKAILERSMPD